MDNYISEIFDHNRRREIRRRVRLPASVSLDETKGVAGSSQGPLSVLAHTRDISANGLALVLPFLLKDDLVSGGHTLRIILALSTGDVEMRCAPVRHERLGESEPDVGYLIGMFIMEMSEDDRTLYLEYLHTLGAE